MLSSSCIRMRQCIKEPVIWPALDASRIIRAQRERLFAGPLKDFFDSAWIAYAEELIETEEHCMEACESIREITPFLEKHGIFHLDYLSGDTCLITDNGKELLTLYETKDGSVMIGFGDSGSIDISDFGPQDAARFILALFRARKPILKALQECYL